MALSPVSSLHGCGAIVHSQKVPVSISQDESDEFINQHKCENDHIHQLWSPLFLRRKVLAFFIVSFTAMIAALAALHIYCDRNQGLSTVNPKQHYLWTYGPSAGMARNPLLQQDELTVVSSVDNFRPVLGSD